MVDKAKENRIAGLLEAAEIADHFAGSLWSGQEQAMARDIRGAILFRAASLKGEPPSAHKSTGESDG